MSVTVLFPAGGETFQGGAPLTVQWNTTDAPSFQAVRLSTDGGVTFTNLTVPDLPGSARSFTFNLPNPPANAQAVVRVAVKDAFGVQFGKGDSAPFTVQPVSTQVMVTAPNGGTFQAGQQLTVQWNTTGPVSSHAVRLSINGGAFTNLATPDLPGTARSFTFTLPTPPAPNSTAVVKVAAKDASGVQIANDDSAPFTLQPVTTQVVVTAPNGGTFQAGQQLTVQWNTTGPVSFHAVRISINGGAFTNLTTPDLPGTARSFTFTLPTPPAPNSTAVVKVAAKDATGVQIANGDSAPFTLQPALPMPTQVVVTSPNGGTFQAGQQLTVQWNTTGPVSSHAVRLSINGAPFTNVTPADLPGTARSFTFSLPSPPSPNASAVVKVAAKDASGVQVANGDSAPFTLQPALPMPTQVVVTAPNGGTFQAGQQLTVQWNTTGPVSSHAVRLSINGAPFTNVTPADLPGTARSFTFSLPSPPAPNSTAVVKVAAKDASGTQIANGDSAPFTLQPALPMPTQVVVTAPNGGVFQAGQQLTVQWNTTGPVSSHAVRLSINGAPFTNLTPADLPGTARSFTFSLPSPPSPNASAVVQVAAKNASGTQVASGNSSPFTLQAIPPSAFLFSPASGPDGVDVVLTGNVAGVQAVLFGGVLSPEFFLEGTGLVAEVPEGVGSGPVTLRLANGTVLTSSTPFTATAAAAKPRITAVTPNCGKATTPVTITGANFVAGQTVVRFKAAGGRVKATNVAVDPQDSGKLTCTVPAGTVTGTVKVTVAGQGKALSPTPFEVEPDVLALAAVEPATLAAGRTNRVFVRGTNLPVKSAGYELLDPAGAAAAKARVIAVAAPAGAADVGLPAASDAFALTTAQLSALGVAVPGDPARLELLVQVDADAPVGSYKLRARICTKTSADVPVTVAASGARAFLPGFDRRLSRGLSPVVPANLPDPSMGALARLAADRPGRLAELLTLVAARVLLGRKTAARRESDFGVTPARDSARASDVPLVLRRGGPAPLAGGPDFDLDCLPDAVEQEFAKAFLPDYQVSAKERAGTGFTTFRPSLPPAPPLRVADQPSPANRPVVHFRVKPLGISEGTGAQVGRRFAVVQVDFLTLWTRDDGLATRPRFLDGLLAVLLPGVLEEGILGHPMDEERSAVLLAAEVQPGESFPPDVNKYRAVDFYVAGHEGTPLIDQSTYLTPPQQPNGSVHLQLFLSLSKHATYEANPDFLPLLGDLAPAALLAVAGLSAAEASPEEAAALTAAVVLFFFVLIVERFPNPTPAPVSQLINVGEPEDGRQLNGARWIQETKALGGRDLRPKLDVPLWEITRKPAEADVPADLELEPAFGPPGTRISILGAGLGDARFLDFGGGTAGFTVVTPSLIRAVVPESARSGPVRVRNCAGAVLASRKAFQVCAGGLPKVGRFVPDFGILGAQVEISGENFADVRGVSFDQAGADFVVNSPTSITAFVPIRLAVGGADRAVAVSVTTARGTAALGGFTVLAPKTNDPLFQLAGFDPAIGGPMTEVAVFGAELDAATEVSFGGVAAPFRRVSTTKLVATVPLNARNGDVRVRATVGGTVREASRGSFLVAADGTPAVERVSPTVGRSRTDLQTGLRVYGLGMDRVTRVRFGSLAAPSFTVDSPFRLTVGSPIGSNLVSELPLQLEFGGAFVGSGRNVFGFISDPPAIESVNPASGAPGTAVTITGRNFTGATLVRFRRTTGGRIDDVDCCFTVQSPTTILATVPLGAEPGPLTVITPAGMVTGGSFTVLSSKASAPVRREVAV